MTAEFHIDPDIRKARTLSSRFYTDEKYFELSKEKIFRRTPQLAAASDDFPEKNMLFPATVLEGFLDEPVLVSWSDNKLNCLSNVCTHRGNILVNEPCQANLIRCGYHGRRFAMDGKFLSMPEFEGVENFPSPADDLPQVRIASWLWFYFVSLDPTAVSVSVMAGDMAQRIAWQKLADKKLVGRKTYTVNAHWALYCENYLEGFHIPFVHDSLNQQLDYGNYTTELFRYSVLQTGYGKAGEPKEIAAQYFFIFPNMMFNFYPWGVSVNIVKPVRPDLTRVEYLTYVYDESKVETGAGAGLETVEFEDQAIVEGVQRGLRSRAYDSGRYSPTREQGCHHFHRLIAEFMG